METFTALFCLLASVNLGWSQGAKIGHKYTPEQLEVIKVSREKADAASQRDFKTWSRYIADDCLFSTDDGELGTKADFIKHVGTMPREYDHTDNPREDVVHVNGDVAVLNYRSTS